MKSKDMIGIFNILEFTSDHFCKEDVEEVDESWWEKNKGAVYAYSLGSIGIIFGLIPWLIGMIMLAYWIFF